MKMLDVYHNQIIGFRNSKGDKVIATIVEPTEEEIDELMSNSLIDTHVIIKLPDNSRGAKAIHNILGRIK